jgi:hypothetical protein
MYTFFEFLPADITALTGYVTSFVSDISPILLPIMAVGLGLIIVAGIISAIKH